MSCIVFYYDNKKGRGGLSQCRPWQVERTSHRGENTNTTT